MLKACVPLTYQKRESASRYDDGYFDDDVIPLLFFCALEVCVPLVFPFSFHFLIHLYDSDLLCDLTTVFGRCSHLSFIIPFFSRLALLHFSTRMFSAMNAKLIFALIPIAVSLIGCNTDSTTLPIEDYTGSPEGLYVNADSAAVMFVGASDSEFPIVISDFDSNSIYATKQVVETFPTIKTQGLISWSALEWINDNTTEFSILIDGTQANAYSNLVDTTVLYTFNKSPKSLSLEELSSGWVETESNANWQINSDGTYRINPFDTCIFEGTLIETHDFYISLDSVASGCTNHLLDGAFPQVRIATFTQNQSTYVVGTFFREDVIIWDNVIEASNN